LDFLAALAAETREANQQDDELAAATDAWLQQRARLQDVLLSWGCDEATGFAGLFASIYCTTATSSRKASFVEPMPLSARADVAAVVGPAAEAVCFASAILEPRAAAAAAAVAMAASDSHDAAPQHHFVREELQEEVAQAAAAAPPAVGGHMLVVKPERHASGALAVRLDTLMLRRLAAVQLATWLQRELNAADGAKTTQASTEKADRDEAECAEQLARLLGGAAQRSYELICERRRLTTEASARL
jgi:hypothetical protein